MPLVAPNDIAADSKGGFYFSDPLGSRFRPTPPGRTAQMLFYIRPDGTLVKVTEQVARPNGLILSPDEKTLYASNGPTVAAFDVQPDGTLRNFRTFAALQGLRRNAQGQPQGNADSICVDDDGRLYVAAGGAGVQVFNPAGQHLGTIPTPLGAQAVAFAGPEKRTLYIVGGGAVYKVPMLARGIQRRAK